VDTRTPPPFERFLEQHRGVVMRFLAVAVGPEDADDVFQETFLSALRAYGRIEDDGRLDRWILRIASRKAIDHHRRSAGRPAPVAELPLGPSVEGASVPDDQGLWAAVAALSPRQRVAMVYRFVEDLPYEEIGSLMGCAPATARALVHQGTRRLREMDIWANED
jgi:RNA polymerase sigma factor (sigma-70 family)